MKNFPKIFRIFFQNFPFKIQNPEIKTNPTTCCSGKKHKKHKNIKKKKTIRNIKKHKKGLCLLNAWKVFCEP